MDPDEPPKNCTLIDKIFGIIGIILFLLSLIALFTLASPEKPKIIYVPGHWEEVHPRMKD